MGTRGLLGYIIRGVRKGSYNHLDSYPCGLGAAIVEFLIALTTEELATLATNVSNVNWVLQDSKPTEELQERYSNAGFLNVDVGEQKSDDWYCLLHKVQGAAALPKILDGSLEHLIDSTEFLKDDLMCEWAYFIDFEKRGIEVWKDGSDIKWIGFDEMDSGEMEVWGTGVEEEEDDDDDDDNEEG